MCYPIFMHFSGTVELGNGGGGRVVDLN